MNVIYGPLYSVVRGIHQVKIFSMSFLKATCPISSPVTNNFQYINQILTCHTDILKTLCPFSHLCQTQLHCTHCTPIDLELLLLILRYSLCIHNCLAAIICLWRHIIIVFINSSGQGTLIHD